MRVYIKLRAKKHLYIEDDKCSHLSYYECCANIFKNENFSNCSKTCIPTSLKSIGSISLAEIPTCYPETEDVCNAWDFFDEMFLFLKFVFQSYPLKDQSFYSYLLKLL